MKRFGNSAIYGIASPGAIEYNRNGVAIKVDGADVPRSLYSENELKLLD